MTVFRHTPEMGEISGFGGGYESACQDMFEAGVKWIMSRTTKPDLVASEYKNIYGIINPESDDAKELSEVILAACPDCSGAMHHATMARAMAVAELGWDGYCEKVLEHQRNKKQ